MFKKTTKDIILWAILNYVKWHLYQCSMQQFTSSSAVNVRFCCLFQLSGLGELIEKVKMPTFSHECNTSIRHICVSTICKSSVHKCFLKLYRLRARHSWIRQVLTLYSVCQNAFLEKKKKELGPSVDESEESTVVK